MCKTSRAGPANISMVSQSEAVCVLECVVHGHHVYEVTWTPTVGEILSVRQEPGNDHDRHDVCIKRGAEIVGHVPRELSRMVWHFLVHGGQTTCEVTEKNLPCVGTCAYTTCIIPCTQHALIGEGAPICQTFTVYRYIYICIIIVHIYIIIESEASPLVYSMARSFTFI